MAESIDGVMSVGRALENNVAFSVSHPLYRGLSDAMEMKVAEMAAEKGAARAGAEPSYVTVALTSDEVTVLAKVFPEFKMIIFPFSRPAHSLFVQLRRMGMEWSMMQARRLASDLCLCGVAVTGALQMGFDRVQMVADTTSTVIVHERHSQGQDAYRLYGNSFEVAELAGAKFVREPYDRYLTGKGLEVHTNFSRVGSAGALCCDGTLYSWSPWQLAMAMAAAGAEVAFGFVPYHPVMLLDDEGELPGYDIGFQRTADEVLFSYPEGVAGVTSYSLDSWRAWLVGHTFQVGKGSTGRWFQLELLKQRGCLMFYRVVQLPARPVACDVVHALDLPATEPQYVVSSRRLTSVTADPSRESGWITKNYVVSQRLVDRVYQFAMQLPREQFTRYAIRKQLHVVNDRVTVEGTSVKVNSALGEEMVDALVVDLFSRCFVDRYDAGTLTDVARRYVDAVSAFSSGTRVQRLWFVATTCSLALWDVTFAPMNRYVRYCADAVRSWATGRLRAGVPEFRIAPSYVLLSGAASGLDLVGGELAARELGRRAAMGSVGLLSEFVRTFAQLIGPSRTLEGVPLRCETFALFKDSVATGSHVDEVVEMVRALNPMDEPPVMRRALETLTVTRQLSSTVPVLFNPVADPVYLLNEVYSAVLPGVAEQDLEYDTASISLDPQDRTLAAPYMRLPKYFGDPPKCKSYYRSKLRALNVPKRQQTLQELLSAIASRNLNAPQVALPQDDNFTARVVWENFLKEACLPDAAERLAQFRRDPVALSDDAFREWVEQSTPDKLAAVRRELVEKSQALGEMDVGDYLVMLKADVKPTLSVKPLHARTEPQVIVYHEKALSALYSSIFRVLVRRFLSLLKPNYHVNLLKDTKDIEAFVRGAHPFQVPGLKYLENDFSKYDKSQGRFVFILEELVFTELGMDSEFLGHWLGGHVECNLRAVSLGLSLHVLYQRKSGDATTAFGNVVLNIMSVSYAYRGTEVVWGVFMGDDSLMCVRGVANDEQAIGVLAEVFNLGAKTYLTDSPYFASNFVLIDDFNREVHFVPDPIKRIERWSMSISAEDPQWRERFVSAADSMATYLSCSKTVLLPKLMAERYNVKASAIGGVADAVATLVGDEGKFRDIWEAVPQMSLY